MADFKYELGKVAEDKLTGFKGILTYRAQYLTGCNNYGIQPIELGEKGEIKEIAQFDESRIRIIGEGVSLVEDVEQVVEEGVKAPGGPQPNVSQQHH
jgi:hypothetical protein